MPSVLTKVPAFSASVSSVSPSVREKTNMAVAPDIVNEAVRVIKIEASGLSQLATHLETGLQVVFEKLVQRLVQIKGRVIVSGMGKSGHVAGKIAATLASTGTPAFCVHPGEASHGDLGMILADDFVILLSNSGETAELSDIIAYTRRFNIPLCGITANPHSTLMQQATYPICIPAVPEACPLGLAPTTSTTLMMAFGDALAVSLLKVRGFTSHDFKKFHPGGKLGQKLLKVSDVMDEGNAIPLVPVTATAGDVILEMTQKCHGCTGVVDHAGDLVGMITDGDLRRRMSIDFMKESAGGLMSKMPVSVSPDLLVLEALALMNAEKITKIFVCDPLRNVRKPIGLLNIHTCLNLELG